MAVNGQAYPAVLLDADGNVLPITEAIQFTDASAQPGTGGGGGGGLPTGWTEDASNPANVDTNGTNAGPTGGLNLGGGALQGDDGAGGVFFIAASTNPLVSVTASDSSFVQISTQAGVQSTPSTSVAFTADGSKGATVALDAGGLTVENALTYNATPAQAGDSAFDGGAGAVENISAAIALPIADQAAFQAISGNGGTVALDAGGLDVSNVGTLTAATVDATTAALTPGSPGDDVLFCNGGAITGFSTAVPNAVPSITGALTTVLDAAAKDVLTSIISALTTLGLATDGTT